MQKLRKRVLAVEVFSVAGDVLRDDGQFFYTEFFQLFCFGNKILHGAAAESAADVGNGAVGTAVVAPLRDLEVRGIFGGGEYAVAAERDGILVVKAGVACLGFSLGGGSCPDSVHDVVQTADAEHRVHLGEFGEDFLAVAFRQASGNDDRLQVSVLFEPCDVENVVYGFFFRAFDEGAGIDDDDIRFGVLGGDFVSRLDDLVKHDLGIQLVLGATEGNKTDFHRDLTVFQ